MILRCCVSLLLAALLATPKGVPLGGAHAHAGGERHHHHAGQGGVVDPDHGGHHSHEVELGPVFENASEPHVHLSWLGISLTLPDSLPLGEPDGAETGKSILGVGGQL